MYFFLLSLALNVVVLQMVLNAVGSPYDLAKIEVGALALECSISEEFHHDKNLISIRIRLPILGVVSWNF
jgi:hypothetical protein